MMNKPSLREMKKEATAHALAEAAFELTLERGLDNFVVEDVVQRAGYSRRTFANHFSCKEAAVAMAAHPYQGIEEFFDLIHQMPETTPPIDALYQFVKMQLAEQSLRRMRQLFTLCKEYPTLEPYTLAVINSLQKETQKLMTDLYRETHALPYIYLLVGAIFAAIIPMLDGTLHVLLPGQSAEEAPGAESFEHLLETAFGYLRQGF
ncbi:TetR/AcrR family transcriptional regulator [Paenibacillus soyae]|uniref:TetR/AcrR family transcriptional regulator n=1 Tax=Paenibacillus soyae TaxID=2969249 RepID=A0A9X2SA53_9BACL|nr:TetR/AcrR family transcriptional regulator [Paenibacillus soyae]MCR2805730.1 TetR/AcrR family transcriptional regulator [Paenibacillus soyae]